MPSANHPIVSIVIPTKNRCQLLQQTLASVQQQTYPNWDAIVVDDGSTDDTAQMMAGLTAAEPRIHYRQRTGAVSGACACRNQGVSASTGSYVIFLDSDDLLAPFCLEQRVHAMQKTPNLDFSVFCGEMFCSQPGDQGIAFNVQKQKPDLDRFLSLDLAWQTTGPIWSRRALEKIGSWDERLPSWQDWEFHVRALTFSLRYQHIPLRDYFLRIADPNRDTIGKHQNSRKHLQAVETILNDTVILLRRAHLFIPARSRLVAGLYVALAINWDGHGDSHRVRQIITRCWQHRICKWGDLAMYFYTLCKDRPGLWRFRQPIQQWLKARHPALCGSDTLKKIIFDHPSAQYIKKRPPVELDGKLDLRPKTEVVQPSIADQNQSVFMTKEVVSEYTHVSWIQPPEAILFLRYHDLIAKARVLDIGVGGGRTTQYLKEITRQYIGIDYSSEMVNLCRNRFPEYPFYHCDVRDLSQFPTNSFDFILFSFNGFDFISHADRNLALREIYRVLSPGGMRKVNTLRSPMTIAAYRRIGWRKPRRL